MLQTLFFSGVFLTLGSRADQPLQDVELKEKEGKEKIV